MKPYGADVAFPITIRFEAGEVEQYEDVEALECTLEDFDSDEDRGCEVRDRWGRPVRLEVKLLELKELSLAP